MFRFVAILTIVFFASTSCATEADPELKSGFVYLSDVDPSIIIDLKYHQDDNFTGKPIRGCNRGRAVISQEAAEALRNVQEDLVMYGYSLMIYDAYHPYKTYEQINSWLTENPNEKNDLYYPNLSKHDLQRLGYIKAKHAHSRGSTVDVSIISLKNNLIVPGIKQKKTYKGQKVMVYLDDGSVDMGTSYDTFDPLSAYSNTAIPETARENRKLLKEAMQNHGFIQDERFWWQFTLAREPYIDSEFDFDI
ncbi:MAG: M15 family metallopeptidase [Rickettsiaceae bacterium]